MIKLLGSVSLRTSLLNTRYHIGDLELSNELLNSVALRTSILNARYSINGLTLDNKLARSIAMKYRTPSEITGMSSFIIRKI